MLIKKIEYFYKIYIRQLKRQYPEINNLNDLIQIDLTESKANNEIKFNLNTENLENKVLWDVDFKILIILEFFREFNGRNPFIKNSNKESIDAILVGAENEIELEEENKKVDEMMIYEEYWYSFLDLSIKEKIEIIYFFCNFALTFSGRAHYYRDDIVKLVKDVSAKDKEALKDKEKEATTINTGFNVINPMPTNTSAPNSAQDIKNYKRIKPLGKDAYGNSYFTLFCNQECRIYKEAIVQNQSSDNFVLEVKNYDELEKFMANMENSKNTNEVNLIKKIKENLLKYKDFDDQEKIKEANFLRKIQQKDKAMKLANGKDEKRNTADYYALMNTSGHVITRNQLNQISKSNHITLLNTGNPAPKKPAVTEEQKRLRKADQDRREREKRLENRKKKVENTLLNKEYLSQFPKERFHKKSLGRKRNRVLKFTKKGGNTSEEEEFSSEEYSSNNSKSQEMELQSDNEDEEDDQYYNEDQANNNSKDMNRARTEPKQNKYKFKEYPSHNPNPQSPNSNLQNQNSFDNYNEGQEFDTNMDEEQQISGNDIILEGNLIYRHTNDQVELDGFWFMSQDHIKERLSYLFMHSNEFIECDLNPNDINESNRELKRKQETAVKLKICSANIFECILINKSQIFDTVLQYLSGEYSGYFMYYGKTIEDKVNLNLSLQESLVKVNGEGTNNLGNFKIIGYMNFFKNKDEILQKNDIESEIIKLADFRFTKIYTAFNPNENYRVIKSFQHRRKKINEDENY